MPNSHPYLTRETLLLRLRDPGDAASWEEFVDLYTPMLYAYCLKRGVRREDAADIVQEVMRTVARQMGSFTYDPDRGTFRAWMHTLLRASLSRFFKKAEHQPRTAESTAILRKLENTPDPVEQRDWDREYEHEMLAWAMAKAKPQFSARVWEVFEETAVRERSVGDVAAKFGMTSNAVNLAKFRVMEKLREIVTGIESGWWEADAAKKKAKV